MFEEKFLTKLFTEKDMMTIPCGCQSTAIHSMERVIEEMVKENPNAKLSELLQPTTEL